MIGVLSIKNTQKIRFLVVWIQCVSDETIFFLQIKIAREFRKMLASVTHCIKLIYFMIQQVNFFRESTCWNVLGGRFGQITHSGPSWTEKRCSCGIILGFFTNFFIIWLFFCIFLHNWIFFNFWRCFSTISWKSKVWKSIIILTFYLYKVMYHNLWFLVGESISRNFFYLH